MLFYILGVAAVAGMSIFATSCKGKDCKCTVEILGVKDKVTYTADQLDELEMSCKDMNDMPGHSKCK